MQSKILQLPKIDLHCHLDGSLSLGLVRNLLNREVQLEELQAADDCKSLAEYLEKFDLPLQCFATAAGLRKGGYDFIEQAAAENVKYIEVRFAPQLSINESLNCSDVIENVLRGLEEGKQKYGVDYRVITCAMRHMSEEENYAMFCAASEFLGKGVCAADLAGDEAAFATTQFASLFGKAKKLGLPFTLHAGECGNAQNIITSVELGAKRIGHGIAMHGQEAVQQLCKECGIGIEMCPISNLQTKAVLKGEDYPIREFLEKGLLVTLNTDNRTVSNTTITKEMQHVHTNYGVTIDEIIQMQKNAIEVAFVGEDVKAAMRKWYE